MDGRPLARGPRYGPAGRYLLFDDISENRMLRWDETTGAVGTFRQPSGYANGTTLDAQARLITCEQGNRRVVRTEHDGRLTVLADRLDGRRLNSPYDAVVPSDGSVWFTDPPYGILSDYEGERAEPETDGCHVYRVDAADGRCRIVADDFQRPNGLAFSVDERALSVADTSRNHIRRFAVEGDGLRGGEVLATCGAGVFDGLRPDTAGRVWAAAGDGVHCFDPDGTLLGKLRRPEECSNLAFGGAKRNRIFVCATTSLYSALLTVNGAPGPLGRRGSAIGRAPDAPRVTPAWG